LQLFSEGTRGVTAAAATTTTTTTTTGTTTTTTTTAFGYSVTPRKPVTSNMHFLIA
jgi:hypothetical protein